MSDQPSDPHIEDVRRLIDTCMSPGFFFVNIGANDGVHNDPIYPFIEQYGWHGVAVEPDPDVFEELRRNYQKFPSVVLEQAAITTEPPRLYRIGKGPFEYAQWMSQITAASEARVREIIGLVRTYGWLGSVPKDLEEYVQPIDVPCMTFEDLVRRHSIERIDYLNIDVEGGDLEVLAQVDLDRFRNRLLCIEMDPERDFRAADAERRLEKLGYQAYKGLMFFSVFYLRE